MKKAYLVMLTATLLTGLVSSRAQTNAADPLPALESVLAHTTDTLGKEDYYKEMFNRHYAYQRERVTETRYANGKLKGRESKMGTNSPVPEIAALPLEPYEPGREPKKRGNELVSVTDLVSSVLAHSQMKIVERQQVGGRATLLVDIQPPKTKLPEKSLLNRIVNRAAGQAWVDEGDYTLARLEAHLTDKIYLFAGFGAVLKGSYGFERERTEDGVWFVRQIEYNADVREVVVYRTIDYRETFTNVHRLPPFRLDATTR